MIYNHNGETLEATRVSPALPLYYNEEHDHFVSVQSFETHGEDDFALEYKIYEIRLETDTSEPEGVDEEWEDEDYDLLSTRRHADIVFSPSDASGLG